MYPGNKRKKVWREEKDRLLKMTLEERRKEYVRDYVPLKDIPLWTEELKSKTESDEENTKEPLLVKKSLSEKVSLYRGDITLLETDAIVNADPRTKSSSSSGSNSICQSFLCVRLLLPRQGGVRGNAFQLRAGSPPPKSEVEAFT